MLGQRWAPDAANPRAVGKTLFVPALFMALAPRLVREAAKAGYVMPVDRAQDLWTWMRQEYVTVDRWRDAQQGLGSFTTPLGRTVVVPAEKYKDGKPALPTVIGSIGQSFEADALRTVVALADERLAGTGAGIVMLMHDGIVIEVPMGHAEEAAARIEALMDEALAWVTGACTPRTTVEICSTWR